jgi:hypothetical protein
MDYPFHDKTIVVTRCGRICMGNKKIDFSQAFAGQAVGIKEIQDDIWLVSFMDYDLGYFDLENRVLESLQNPFGPKLSSYLQARRLLVLLPETTYALLLQMMQSSRKASVPAIQRGVSFVSTFFLVGRKRSQSR